MMRALGYLALGWCASAGIVVMIYLVFGLPAYLIQRRTGVYLGWIRHTKKSCQCRPEFHYYDPDCARPA